MVRKKITTGTVIAASIAGLLGSTAITATDFNGTVSINITTGVTIVSTTALSFGTLGIVNPTDMPAETVVTTAPADGRVSSNNTSNILVIQDGVPVQLVISAAPPNALLTFTDTAPGTTLVRAGADSAVTIRNFVSSVPLVTDANGNLTVNFGAEAVFHVNSSYGSGHYFGSYTISIDF